MFYRVVIFWNESMLRHVLEHMYMHVCALIPLWECRPEADGPPTLAHVLQIRRYIVIAVIVYFVK